MMPWLVLLAIAFTAVTIPKVLTLADDVDLRSVHDYAKEIWM